MPKCISPLRYPGGKAKLYNKVSKIVADNFEQKPIYCEPFAGGFGLGISLLLNDDVSRVIINDLDYCIYAFWMCITDNDLYPLIKEKILGTPVSIEEWKKQKNIYKNHENNNILDVGFATFFLNRCNRSGILSANPIGGINQTGKYNINCRFNKETLINQIDKIHQHCEQIEVYNEDALDLIIKIDKRNNILFNIDPPYIKAGPELYKNNYVLNDHIKLSETVKTLNNKWIMTYDNKSIVYDMYKGFLIKDFDLNYSLESKHTAKELMIFSPEITLKLPSEVLE